MKNFLFFLYSAFMLLIGHDAYSCIRPNDAIHFYDGTDNAYSGGNGCYIISVPYAYSDAKTKERTTVYLIHPDKDEALYQYDWYAKRLVLHCGKFNDGAFGISMVRGARQPDDQSPESSTILEFYFDGKLVKTYSYGDLVPDKKEYWSSGCGVHFDWRGDYERAPNSPQKFVYHAVFRTKIVDFDLRTGEILREKDISPSASRKILYPDVNTSAPP